MTTIEIKKSIIQRIAQIEDLNFLKAIKTIIESNSTGSVFFVPPKMKEKIQYSRKHARQGHIISNKDLTKEIEDWLRKGK